MTASTLATDNILEIKNLSKQYPGFFLDSISLSIPKGSIMGLIGENGAGKSTTILSILGAVNRDSGTVRILGQDTAQGIPLPLKEQIGVVLFPAPFSPIKPITQPMGRVRSMWSRQKVG